jgi:hypothetical protein
MLGQTIRLLIRALIIGIVINVGLQQMPAEPAVVTTRSATIQQSAPLTRSPLPQETSLVGHQSNPH